MEQEQSKPSDLQKSDLQKNIILHQLIGNAVGAYVNVAHSLHYILKLSAYDFRGIYVREKDSNTYCAKEYEHYTVKLIQGFIELLDRYIVETENELNYLKIKSAQSIAFESNNAVNDEKYDFVTFPLCMITQLSIKNISANCCDTYYIDTKTKLTMWIIHVDVLLLELKALKQICITVNGILDKDISEICKEIRSTYVKYFEENNLIERNRNLKKTLYYTEETFHGFVKDFHSCPGMINFVPCLDEIRSIDLKDIIKKFLSMLNDIDKSDGWSYINACNYIDGVNDVFRTTNNNTFSVCITNIVRCLVEIEKISYDIKKSIIYENCYVTIVDLFMRYSWYYYYNITISVAKKQWKSYKELTNNELYQGQYGIKEFIKLKILKLNKYINDLGNINNLATKQILLIYKYAKNHRLRNKLLLLKIGRVFVIEYMKSNFLSQLTLYADKLFYLYKYGDRSIPFDVRLEDVEAFKKILTNQPLKCHLKYTPSTNPGSLLAALFENLEVFTDIKFTFKEVYCNEIETSFKFINKESLIEVSCDYTYPEIILEILCVLSNHFLSDFEKKSFDEQLLAMAKVIAIDKIISKFIPPLEKQIVNDRDYVDRDNIEAKTMPTHVLSEILLNIASSFMFSYADKKAAVIQKLLISILKDREREQQKSEFFSLIDEYDQLFEYPVYKEKQKNINIPCSKRIAPRKPILPQTQIIQERQNTQEHNMQVQIIQEEQNIQKQDMSQQVLQKRENPLIKNDDDTPGDGNETIQKKFTDITDNPNVEKQNMQTQIIQEGQNMQTQIIKNNNV